jgi:hypothetical protein
MPCHEERTVAVSLDGASLDVLGKALATLGFSVKVMGSDLLAYRVVDGVFVTKVSDASSPFRIAGIATGSPLVNQIRVAYAEQAIKVAARRVGWGVAKTGLDQCLLVRGKTVVEYGADAIKVTVLKDGVLKVVAENDISIDNHSSADSLLKLLTEIMGGEDRQEARPGTSSGPGLTYRHGVLSLNHIKQTGVDCGESDRMAWQSKI